MKSIISGAVLMAALVSAVPMLEGRSPAKLDPLSLVKRVVTPDNSCGNVNAGNNKGYSCPVGECCSEWGWCGTTSEHCGNTCQSTFGSCNGASVSPSGRCGMVAGGQNMGYSCPVGQCCSEYGWCGTGSTYCQAGCQFGFGTCAGGATTTPATGTAPTGAAPTPTAKISPDSRCGMVLAGQGKGYTCPAGECCSQYGWCGPAADYCMAGCQSAFGHCGEFPSSSMVSSSSSVSTSSSTVESSSTAASSTIESSSTATSTVESSSTASSSTIESSSTVATSTTATTPTPTSIIPPRTLFGNVPYGVSIQHCTTKSRTVGLAFVGAPNDFSHDIMDLLATFGFKATFFINGQGTTDIDHTDSDENANTPAGYIDDISKPWPSILRRMVAEGHHLASNTFSGQDMSTLTYDEIVVDMIKHEEAIKRVLGLHPTYMHPPNGKCDGVCAQAMKALGYHIITGDLDTRDREFSTPETSQQAKDIFRTALREREAVGHMLPVMHDNLMQTVHNLAIDALRQLQNNNWSGVTVGECLGDPEPQWYRN